MLKIGLTGGIGTGKSTVSKIFSLLKVPIYEADRRAKILLNNDRALKIDIIELFGSQAYENGTYNSKWIASQVFANKDLLLKLNNLVHPLVARDWEEWCMKNTKNPYVVKEAAIMKAGNLDFIVNVTSPLEIRIKRILGRDAQRSRKDILSIIAKQKSDDEFKSISDYEIKNGDKDLLIPQVIAIHEQLLNA